MDYFKLWLVLNLLFFLSLFHPPWLQVLNLPTFSHAPTYSIFPFCLCNRVFPSHSLLSVIFPLYLLHQRPFAHESTLASPQSQDNITSSFVLRQTHPLLFLTSSFPFLFIIVSIPLIINN
ncbi:hypothetical protein F5H01DRAFT_154091 [Linnemannia elongata]|nr:hypothetical protein F5H01DRAFT_154091 [Linnemannia elongata]